MIFVSDPNPVLVKIILSVSENYPKVYYDAQHTFLCGICEAKYLLELFCLSWTRLAGVVTWQAWNACPT